MKLLKSTLSVDFKTCIWVAFLSVLIAGIRGSDGRALLAIASRNDMNDLAMSYPLNQYIWDSPLKVALLRLLPSNMLWISLAFMVIAVLPLTGLFVRRNKLFSYLTGILILITPAITISFQSVGVGDGLISLLTLLAVINNSNIGIAVPFFLIGLWHPHQAFFIGCTYIIFKAVFKKDDFKKCLISTILGLFAASIVFYLYRASLGFSYVDRVAYMYSAGLKLFLRNLRLIPLAIFYPVFWLFIIKRMFPDLRMPFYAIIWIIICISVILFTCDVTRSLSNVLLPMILIAMKKKYFECQPKGSPRVPLLWVVIAALMPHVSWSGADIFLWPAFAKDLCKYFSVCF